MALFLKYEGIDGPVTAENFEKWIECHSFQFGIGRAIGTASRGALNREGSEPHLSEIVITKEQDSSSPLLFEESVAGLLNKKVTFHFTTTSSGKMETFAKYELVDCGISSLSISGGGDDLHESVSINFAEITFTFTGMNPDVSGTPMRAHWDLRKNTK